MTEEWLTLAQFKWIQKRIHQVCGSRPADEKTAQVGKLVHERMFALGIDEFVEYQQRLSESRKELLHLAGGLTVGETHFFRHRDHWAALERCLLPWLLAERGDSGRPLRIWSAGCSSGEEAFTAAFLLQTAHPEWTRRELEIIGTDLNPAAVHAAEEAIYGENSFRGVPQAMRERHFETLVGGRFRPRAKYRELVRFRQMNLLDEKAANRLGEFDLVFCRNVLIYFDAPHRDRVIEMFHKSLRTGGYLMLGGTEAAGSSLPGFANVVTCKSGFYRTYPGSIDEEKQMQPLERVGRVGPLARKDSPDKATLTEIDRSDRVDQEAPTTPPALDYASRVAAPDSSSDHVESQKLDQRRERALTQFFAEKNSAAQKTYEAILESHPKDLESLVGMALLLAGTGELESALEYCERALASDRVSAEAYCVRGIVRAGLGATRAAHSDLERAASLDSDFAMAHFHLACLYVSGDQPEEAARAFGCALGAFSRDSERRLRLHSGGFERDTLVRICEHALADESAPCILAGTREESSR